MNTMGLITWVLYGGYAIINIIQISVGIFKIYYLGWLNLRVPSCLRAHPFTAYKVRSGGFLII